LSDKVKDLKDREKEDYLDKKIEERFEKCQSKKEADEVLNSLEKKNLKRIRLNSLKKSKMLNV